MASRLLSRGLLRDVAGAGRWCSSQGVAKPLTQIPGPKSIPLFGSFFSVAKMDFRIDQMHKFLSRVKEQYGRIARLSIFQFSFLYVFDPQAAETIFRNEGKYPRRAPLDIWKLPREKRGLPLSAFLADGEQWARIRHAIDKPLLVLANVHLYAPMLNDISRDLLCNLENSQKGSKVGEIEDLRDHMLRWSTESVSAFLFDRRIGCLSEEPPKDATDFYENIDKMFTYSAQLMTVYDVTLCKIFKPFTLRKHNQAWFKLFDISQKYIDERLNEIEGRIGKNEPVDGYLATIVKNGVLTRPEIHSTTIELMGAGVDSTASTVLWFLYLLGINPEKQQALFDEVKNGVELNEGGQANVPVGYLRHAPYLKACLHETNRMFPVIMGNTRILPVATELCGYQVPKNTTVMTGECVMSRDPSLFADPLSFRPERWLHEGEERQDLPRFASSPFGFGPRGCVGRRLAESEVYILIGQLVRKFRIECLNEEPVEIKTNILMIPKVPVRVKLLPRGHD